MTRYALILLLALGLAACVGTDTSDIGATVNETGIENPHGQSSFRLVFDKDNPGIPESVFVTLGTDQKGFAWDTTYKYPEGPEISWDIRFDENTGQNQTRALLDTLSSVADTQANAASQISGETLKAIVEGFRIGFGVPGG